MILKSDFEGQAPSKYYTILQVKRRHVIKSKHEHQATALPQTHTLLIKEIRKNQP